MIGIEPRRLGKGAVVTCPTGKRWARFALFNLLFFLTAFATAAATTLQPLPTPALKGVDAETVAAIDATKKRVEQLEQQQAADAQRAEAWGELGMFYQAHRQLDAALPCYANAASLDPENFRWPYYQGLIHEIRGDTAKAAGAFELALQLKPDYAPTRLRLARLKLTLGDTSAAERLFRELLDNQDFRAAALAGLGRVALQARHYRDAVEQLRQAMELDPRATGLHYPLGQALRALGDPQAAREHFAQYGEADPTFPDPLRADLDGYVSGEGAHLRRAMQAVRERDFRTAAAEFGTVLEKQPDNVNLRVSYARALYLAEGNGAHSAPYAAGVAPGAGGAPSDRQRTAEQELLEALQRAPAHPLANYFLGVLQLSQGRPAEARRHFETTLAHDPEHAGAHHHLADTLFLAGDYRAAERHYGRAVELVPADFSARYMQIVAAWRAGEDWAALRDRIEAARRQFPEQPLFRYLAARLLAAAPDEAVRNGQAAVQLAEGLQGRIPPPEYAATLAMAHAARGDFEQAQQLQQQAIDAAANWGRFDIAARMEVELENYRNGRIASRPFNPTDPIFQPMPVDAARVFQDYPSDEPY